MPKQHKCNPLASHSAYWRGRKWTIASITDQDANRLCGKDANAGVDLEKGFIIYRGSLTKDEAIMSILHEMFHEMFPEWTEEPSDNSKSELGIGERDMKAALEAFGVDLSPLLPKTKKKS